MIYKLKSVFSKNLAKPSSGIGGYLVSKFLVRNKPLEMAATDLSNIQPHHQVLEVGFGPGFGLKEAFKKVSGRIITKGPKMLVSWKEKAKNNFRGSEEKSWLLDGDGSGAIHGIDISPRMYKLARKNLRHEISTGKIHLHTASVTDIPYPENKFDAIFHCNCYYFWPDMDSAVQELHRVLQPDMKMLAALDLKFLENLKQNDCMQFGNIDPDRYMKALERNGFNEVYIKDVKSGHRKIQAIFATAKK